MAPYELGHPSDTQVKIANIVILSGFVEILHGFEMARAGYGTHMHQKLK